MSDPVSLQHVSDVLLITLDCPGVRNAVNQRMAEAIIHAVDVGQRSKAIVLTGRDPSFCAGLNLRDLGVGELSRLPRFVDAVAESSVPIIAAVNGPAITAGLEMALACDFIIASDRASFGYPEVRLGQPTIVGAIRLPRRIAWADAMELLLTGERVDAARAEAMRLVWKVVEHDQLLVAANDLARRLCQNAPLAIRATKEVAHRTRAMPWIEAVRFGETMRKVANQTEDAAEARRAASEGRPPQWRGA